MIVTLFCFCVPIMSGVNFPASLLFVATQEKPQTNRGASSLSRPLTRQEVLLELIKRDYDREMRRQMDEKLLSLKEVYQNNLLSSTINMKACKVLDLFLKKGAAPDVVIWEAAMDRDTRYMELLLKYGGNVNFIDGSYRRTPLAEAAISSQYFGTEMLRFLLSTHRCTQANLDQSLLDAVVYIRPFNAAERDPPQPDTRASFALLVKAGARLNISKTETPLILAVYRERLDYAKELVRLGSNVFVRDSDGHDALWHAKHSANYLSGDPKMISAEDVALVKYIESVRRTQRKAKLIRRKPPKQGR